MCSFSGKEGERAAALGPALCAGPVADDDSESGGVSSPRAGDAPDHIADIVGYQQRAIWAERDADRSSVRELLIGCEKA
jgi:hypothetical protein